MRGRALWHCFECSKNGVLSSYAPTRCPNCRSERVGVYIEDAKDEYHEVVTRRSEIKARPMSPWYAALREDGWAIVVVSSDRTVVGGLATIHDAGKVIDRLKEGVEPCESK